MRMFCPCCGRNIKFSAPRTNYTITDKGKALLAELRKEKNTDA